MEKERLNAVMFTLCAAALWGTSFPVVKIGLENVNPLNFLMWRFLLATLVLLTVGLLSGTDFAKLLRPETALLGLVMALAFLMQYLGQMGTTASEAAVLINTSPIIVPPLGYMLISERLDVKKWPAVAFGVAGVLLMSGIATAGKTPGFPVMGTIELLTSALFTSVYIIISKRSVPAGRPVDTILGSFIFASVFVLAFTFVSGNASLSVWSTAFPAASVVYLSLFCTAMPFLLWFRGLRSLSATGSTVITLFEPVVGILISVLFLREAFTAAAAAGTALIFLAIVIIGAR